MLKALPAPWREDWESRVVMPPHASVSWIPALVRDLQNHRGTSLVIAGEQQPAAVHALAHAINDALGNVGKTVHYADPAEASPVNGLESLKELVADIQGGQVDTLFILGVNPVYDAPPDLHFAETPAQGKNSNSPQPL